MIYALHEDIYSKSLTNIPIYTHINLGDITLCRMFLNDDNQFSTFSFQKLNKMQNITNMDVSAIW